MSHHPPGASRHAVDDMENMTTAGRPTASPPDRLSTVEGLGAALT